MANNSQLDSLINKSDIAALPVLHNTLQVLKSALEKPSFNYRYLDKILHFDPACMINLLSYANLEVNKDFNKEIRSVEHAAMFLGIERLEKFIGKISSTYSIKDKKIADKIIKLQHRGIHAALQAQNFARLVKDSSANEIYISALVSPLSELICWHLEPVKAQKVELLIHKNHLNYEEAQQKVFGFSYHELAETLSHQWKIPGLFVKRQEMKDFEKAPKAVKCMYLAEKTSILAEKGWYYDAMYEHVTFCAETLHYPESRIAHELHKTAVELAHNSNEFFSIQAISSYLALLPGEVPYTQVINIEEPKKKSAAKKKTVVKKKAATPVTAQNLVQKTTSKPEPIKVESVKLISSSNDFPGLIRITMDALFETNAFNRVAFMMLSKDKKKLQVRSIRGYNNSSFTETALLIKPTNLFTKLLSNPQTIFINQQNYQKFTPLINQSMKDMLNVQEFIAKSVHVKGKPIGVIYLDNHPLEEEPQQAMQVEDFQKMKKVCTLFDNKLKIFG